MVAEANQPGASVADIARRHGVNANLLFNWRKLSQATVSPVGEPSEPTQRGQPASSAAVADPPSFIPIGLFGRAEDEGPALIATAGPVAGADVAPACRRSARPAIEDRPGMIEIDLVDGTRLRVDAFVNERSLRRVLAVLKAVW